MAEVGEEGKLLSEALSAVKIQTQQMKRFLVSSPLFPNCEIVMQLSRRRWISLWML